MTGNPRGSIGGVLVHEGTEGHTGELAAFFMEHRWLLRCFLVAQGCPDCDSDDIVQDAFLIAWTRWQTIAYYDNPKAYLYKVAIRLWHRAAAHRGQTGSHDEQQDVLETTPGQIDVGGYVELSDTLTRWFGRLPAQQRKVAGLRLIADLSEVATADILGISLGTVKSQLNAARKKLAELRDKDERDEHRDGGER